MTCPECKGTGEYVGLTTREPCRACRPMVDMSVTENAHIALYSNGLAAGIVTLDQLRKSGLLTLRTKEYTIDELQKEYGVKFRVTVKDAPALEGKDT